MEDDKIIRLFLSRDQTAIRETAASYGTGLYQLAMRILHSREDALECVNDTYLKAWQTIPPQQPDFLFAYLAKICRFIAFGRLDWQNARKRKAEIVELTAEMELCIPNPDDMQRMTGEEIGFLLSSFLRNQPEESRLIFLRRYWYGDSVREIAQRYGISESKVKTRLFRTRSKLKIYLESEGFAL